MATPIYLLDGDLDCILDILEEDVSFKEEVEKITTNVSKRLAILLIQNKCKCVVIPIFKPTQ